MKNTSPLSAACISYCSNSRENCSLLMEANGSNFGLLSFAAFSLNPAKLNTGGLVGSECASDTCLNAERQFHHLFIATNYRNQKIYLFLSLTTPLFLSLPVFLKKIDCLISH